MAILEGHRRDPRETEKARRKTSRSPPERLVTPPLAAEHTWPLPACAAAHSPVAGSGEVESSLCVKTLRCPLRSGLGAFPPEGGLCEELWVASLDGGRAVPPYQHPRASEASVARLHAQGCGKDSPWPLLSETGPALTLPGYFGLLPTDPLCSPFSPARGTFWKGSLPGASSLLPVLPQCSVWSHL